MNLLQVNILEIHSVEDVTDKCKWATEPMVAVDMTTDCYGKVERIKHIFCESAWECAKEKGWYLA